jgi:hypothetical protein
MKQLGICVRQRTRLCLDFVPDLVTRLRMYFRGIGTRGNKTEQPNEEWFHSHTESFHNGFMNIRRIQTDDVAVTRLNSRNNYVHRLLTQA